MYRLHISDESFVHPESEWYFNKSQNIRKWFEQEFITWYDKNIYNQNRVKEFYNLNYEPTYSQLLDCAQAELTHYCDIEEIKTVD